MARAPLRTRDRVALTTAGQARVAQVLARHPYRDELLGRDWQIVGTQNQSGVQLFVISPHEWEEQGARLLAYDEELTLVE